MKQFDRIQLNASIQELIDSNGSLAEARQAVYEFGISLPAASRVSGSVVLQTPGEGFTGFTEEQGNVQIDDEKDQIKKMEFGAPRARIGAYKIWREKTKRGRFRIAIGHFWKLDEGTESTSEAPQVWCLECDQNGPLWFGERATRVMFEYFGLCLKQHLFVESWGDHVGKRHSAGYGVEFSIGG
jgi:hypothetical protein